MEADGPANTKTRERTEGAATAVQVMYGDSCTIVQKVQDGPKASISFDVKAKPSNLPCREDVLIENGAAAPKSCLPSLEMRSSTAAGHVVPTCKTSKAAETTVNEPRFQFYSTEEENSKKKNLWTSSPSARYDSSFWKLLATPSGLRVFETKPMQNKTFNPGGSRGRLSAFWDRGARCFLVRLYVLEQLDKTAALFGGSMIRDSRVFRRFDGSFGARPGLKMPCKNKSRTVGGGSRG